MDLGSSGLRIALIDGAGQQAAEESCAYPAPFSDPSGWLRGLIDLVNRLPRQWRQQIGAIAVDGTSGTLLLCHPDGEPPAGQLGQALPYHQACRKRRPDRPPWPQIPPPLPVPAAAWPGPCACSIRRQQRGTGLRICGCVIRPTG